MEPEVKIRQILCDLLDCEGDDLTEDTFLSDDLGLTPDDLEELIGLIQDEFDIEVPDVDAEDWETYADVVNYVIEKMENE